LTLGLSDDPAFEVEIERGDNPVLAVLHQAELLVVKEPMSANLHSNTRFRVAIPFFTTFSEAQNLHDT
jgi:hypothetical protein